MEKYNKLYFQERNNVGNIPTAKYVIKVNDKLSCN